jgi:hypothetical protein
MPGATTMLVDNNALSRPELASRVQGKIVYLPDAVAYELFGSGQWERSIPECLAPLAQFANQVLSTAGFGDLLRRELESGKPTQSIVGDPIVNSRIGRILIACRDEPQRAVDYFRETQPLASAERAERMAQVSTARTLWSDTIDRLRTHFGQPALDRCWTKPELVASYLKSVCPAPLN